MHFVLSLTSSLCCMSADCSSILLGHLNGCRGIDHIADFPDLCPQGFLAPGTDVTPIAPALQEIWQDSMGRSLADFNFRTVTSKFNDLVYQYPIRIPERYSLVIRCAHCASLLASLIRTLPDWHLLRFPYSVCGLHLTVWLHPSYLRRLILSYVMHAC